MSVVIIGGNECMERQYQQICKKHGCKAKVFVKEKSGFSKQIGTPDLMLLIRFLIRWFYQLLQRLRRMM